jgi:hypothetical protein
MLALSESAHDQASVLKMYSTQRRKDAKAQSIFMVIGAGKACCLV